MARSIGVTIRGRPRRIRQRGTRFDGVEHKDGFALRGRFLGEEIDQVVPNQRPGPVDQ